MKVGYARISTPDQNIGLQEDALKNAGCEKVFSEVVTGKKAERLELEKVISFLREGDTLIVWKLDRLGRSIHDLIKIVRSLEEKNIIFVSLQENIDTKTSTGKLMFHMFSALAEFERDLIIERTHAGLAAARARGRMGGRPSKLDTKQIKHMIELYDARVNTVKDICKIYDVSRFTFYNYLNKVKKKENYES